jgi:hypothetical protein
MYSNNKQQVEHVNSSANKKTCKVTYKGIEPQFFTKLCTLHRKLLAKNNKTHTNNKPPQPHKIEAQETKNL